MATAAGPPSAPMQFFLRRHLRLILTSCFACGALYLALSGVDWPTFVTTLQSIDYLSFLGFMAVFSVVLLVGDSLATTAIFRRTVGKIQFSDVMTLRAASYLPSMVNYHLGQAMFTWFLSRRHQTPVWMVVGATLLSYASTLGALVLIASASYIQDSGRFPLLGSVLWTSAILAVVYLVALRLGRSLALKFPPSRVLSEAGLSGHLWAVAARLPHVGILFLGTWLPYFFFDIEIPTQDALALIPVLLLVSALPLTPQGFGTREVVAVQLLSPYAPGSPDEAVARIAACSLCWTIALTLFEVVISLATAKRASQLVPSHAADDAPAVRSEG